MGENCLWSSDDSAVIVGSFFPIGQDGQSLSLSASAMEGSPRLPGWMVMVIDQILALREGMPNETSKFNNDSSTCAMSLHSILPKVTVGPSQELTSHSASPSHASHTV